MIRNGAEKLEAITPRTLIGGVDIAKNIHWARFVDYRGVELGKAVKIENNKAGFETIVANIMKLYKEKVMDSVLIGMEPTGPYWKALAYHLRSSGIEVVMVNPYHTKRSKELDDNSPTKNDRKDALVIARLVKDGRYFKPYLPEGIYAEIRVLANNRRNIITRINSVKNQVIGILDEYFPEYPTVFRDPFEGKASMQILKICPFPSIIQRLGVNGVVAEIQKAVKRAVGRKRAEQLVEVARKSVGVRYGLEGAQMNMCMQLEQLELLRKQLEVVETQMENTLQRTGLSEYLLSIKGAGVVSMSSLLGEIGDPMRFESPRQIHRLAGYNLVEDSSGKNKSGTVISKRGRAELRSLLYLMAMGMVANNDEMKQLYYHLKTREQNALKSKQALVVVAKKIITIIYNLIKKKEKYRPEQVFNNYRKAQMGVAA